MCVPGLVLNETKQDDTGIHFPIWRDCDKTTCFWSRCLGKSGKKLGKILNVTGPLSISRESLKFKRVYPSRKSWRVPKINFVITFGNSQVFTAWNKTGSSHSELRDWVRTGKRMFPKVRDATFPSFLVEISGSREMAFGNANPYAVGTKSDPWASI